MPCAVILITNKQENRFFRLLCGMCHVQFILFTTKVTKDTKVPDAYYSELRALRVLLRKYTCSDDLRIDNDSLFRHTGAGRYPSPLPPLDAGLRRHDESKE